MNTLKLALSILIIVICVSIIAQLIRTISSNIDPVGKIVSLYRKLFKS